MYRSFCKCTLFNFFPTILFSWGIAVKENVPMVQTISCSHSTSTFKECKNQDVLPEQRMTRDTAKSQTLLNFPPTSCRTAGFRTFPQSSTVIPFCHNAYARSIGNHFAPHSRAVRGLWSQELVSCCFFLRIRCFFF